jgi:hypothetical protein
MAKIERLLMMANDGITARLEHRISVAQYDGDRTPADGPPDRVVEVEWSEDADPNDPFAVAIRAHQTLIESEHLAGIAPDWTDGDDPALATPSAPIP